MEALRREVARLRAGEADEAAPEGSFAASPAQWLRGFNDLPADRRLRVIEAAIANADTAWDCRLGDFRGVGSHAERLAEAAEERKALHEARRELAELRRDLAAAMREIGRLQDARDA